MRTVDGRVIRIKGNRREERARRRKRIAVGFIYFVLTAMILVLCGILINWMLQPHESKPIMASDVPVITTQENEDPASEIEVLVKKTEINSVDPAYIEEMLQEFKVVDAVSDSATNASVHPLKYTLFGRWYQTYIDGILCNNTVTQGSMVFFKIRGTDGFDIRFINRAMMETPVFAYSIDGGNMQRQIVSDGHVSLPDFGEHTVCLVMDGISEREFKWSGEIGFAFSDIDCGIGTMSAYTPDQKTILFLGDSLTEGIMSLGPESVSEYNSAVHSYCWYLAQNLNANPYFIGYGSTGITQGGSFNTMSSSLDYLSETRPISEADYPACDLIVINTGTNDLEASDDEFYRGYCDILNKLHNRYPEIRIVCMIPLKQIHAEQIRQAAQQYDFVYTVETGDWEISYSDEGQTHPNDSGSQVIAQKLEEYIRQNSIF